MSEMQIFANKKTNPKLGYYNSIGLLKLLLANVAADYPNLPILQIPGSVFQKYAFETSFVGWNGEVVKLDDEADQVHPLVMFSKLADGTKSITVRFSSIEDEQIIPIKIESTTIESDFRAFVASEPDCGFD